MAGGGLSMARMGCGGYAPKISGHPNLNLDATILHPECVPERWKRHAIRIVTELQDDIDGSDATQTVRFAVGGIKYEIDLSGRNANRFRESIAEFIGHARKVSGRGGRKAASTVGADISKAGQMREWLMEHGYDVSERGRIPDWLQQVYHDRH